MAYNKNNIDGLRVRTRKGEIFTVQLAGNQYVQLVSSDKRAMYESNSGKIRVTSLLEKINTGKWKVIPDNTPIYNEFNVNGIVFRFNGSATVLCEILVREYYVLVKWKIKTIEHSTRYDMKTVLHHLNSGTWQVINGPTELFPHYEIF